MSNKFRTIISTLFLLLVTSSAAAQESVLREADAAFAAGDEAGALRLYDTALQTDPANVHLLVRSAQLLSWKKRFPEAVSRYDAALKVDPNNSIAIMERAKILSWTRRYEEAVSGFREMLRKEPGNHEARLGVARTLSWSNQLVAARKEYQALLAENPNDVDALIGVAQTHAWSGDGKTARDWYERALKLDPAALAATLGLAYADLSNGQRRSASRRASDLAARYPNDGDVRELGLAIRAATLPNFELAQELLEDSDDNELGISRARVTFPLAGRADLSASVARYAMETGRREGTIDTAHLQTAIKLSTSSSLTLRGGVDRSERSDGRRRNRGTGSASIALGSERRFRLIAFADRDTFKYSIPILDSDIDVDSFGLRLVRSSDRWILDGGAATAEFSDGNDRQTADGVILYRWPARTVAIATGYGYRYLNFDHPAFSGYFDPENFNAHTLQIRVSRRFASRFEINVSGETGVQSFTHRGSETENDQFAAGTATLTVPLGRIVLFDMSASRSESAISAASGFESTQFLMKLRIQH